jgi:ADP-ribose pyrophosphatase YjhB (NUDIX family)
VAAYGLVRDHDGRVLMVRATVGHRAWFLPGGGVEHGEHPEDAMVRETREETGLDVRSLGLLVVLSDVQRLLERNVTLHTVRLVFEADVERGALRAEASGTSEQPRWCTPDELRALPLAPFVATVLDHARAW